MTLGLAPRTRKRTPKRTGPLVVTITVMDDGRWFIETTDGRAWWTFRRRMGDLEKRRITRAYPAQSWELENAGDSVTITDTNGHFARKES